MRNVLVRGLLLTGGLVAAMVLVQAQGPEPGLLFHLSGERGLTADHAASGLVEPNFSAEVRSIADGAHGRALECGHTQLLSYWAPGNIFAERGTLSFFWRSREPVGPTAFPIFRVGYADHSSWDMVWLRIDYNGASGFDAFVTDVSLARVRVSHRLPSFPGPKAWIHLAFAWDETVGVRLYVDGRLVARRDAPAMLAAALDQFGPHSRTISPMQVQSAYNFVRGGDLDELRIYDRMLSDEQVTRLSRGDVAGTQEESADVGTSASRQAQWWRRYGWDRDGVAPPLLAPGLTAIRKVEIHDVFDLRRWWWKATDGIRETTWPGVFNRSRLPGRNDYFQLPDWDTYSQGGAAVTFVMPDEPWNHLEVSGAAWGRFDLESPGGVVATSAAPLLERSPGQERTFHRLEAPQHGGRLRFTNVEQETPIGELAAYFVGPGQLPAGAAELSYQVTPDAEPVGESLTSAVQFIAGRYPPAERSTVIALPAGAPRRPRTTRPGGLPIVHVVVPSGFRDDAGPERGGFSYTWENIDGGLDGLLLDLPALALASTHGDRVPLNIQVRDPLWPLRAMLDVSVSVTPGVPATLWLDLRDRILPPGRGLFLSIAAASPAFGAASLAGATVRLVFKPRAAALPEHTLDRFTQVRDNYAQIVEERPNTRRLRLYARFEDDLADLLRAAPAHRLGREYWYDVNREQPAPPVTLSSVPAGVPRWAWRQVEDLQALEGFVHWYIDHRQVANGEFGGGLSDDGDLTNWWPGTALMGVTPSKIAASLSRHLEAFYEQGMFTNGLSTIQTDELHSYEEGIQVLGQSLVLDYGNPKVIERAMESARALERITGVNAAGHRHIRSSYFSGTTIAEDGVWGWSKPSSYLILHPALELVAFNGAPRSRTLLLELADALLAHRGDGSAPGPVRATVEFSSDRDLDLPSDRAWPLLWAAWRWTSDQKYLRPLLDAGWRAAATISGDLVSQTGNPKRFADLGRARPGALDAAQQHLAWQVTGDLERLASLYEDQVRAARLREFINTEGSLWIDRVQVATAELQRARLGGIAQVRNSTFSGHAVSWRFAPPATAGSVAILVPEATPRRLRILAFNLEALPVAATLTGWDVLPGTWSLVQGTATADGRPVPASSTLRSVAFERTVEVPVTLPPRQMTFLELSLTAAGEPYWARPDLGLSAEDVVREGQRLRVTVHSLGGVDAPAGRVVVRDQAGRVVGSGRIPPLPAPRDLRPKTTVVAVPLTRGGWAGGKVTIELPRGEITLRNNVVTLGG